MSEVKFVIACVWLGARSNAWEFSKLFEISVKKSRGRGYETDTRNKGMDLGMKTENKSIRVDLRTAFSIRTKYYE